MPSLEIQKVSNRSQRKQFLELPWRLYKGDPNWVPPLRMDQEELVNYRKHPFYNTAEIETFLAVRNGQPCGRIAAIVNHAHNERYREQRGFFGFFESIDDQEVATGLFDAALAWLKTRGMKGCRGPVNPSLNYPIGTLVQGFEQPPVFLMTYNPSYHDRLITGAGFAKTQDLFAFLGHTDMLETMDKKVAFIAEEARRRFKVTMRPINRRRFQQDVRTFLDIYNKSLIGTWGFVPLSDAEVTHLAEGLKHLIVPELTSIAEIDGQPIGAAFVLLDYNPRIKAIDGRLFPFGFLRLLWNRRAIKKIRFVSTNVLPEYQAWGISLAMLQPFVQAVKNWGIQDVEFSWVLESNHLSRKTLERGGAIRQKTYRLYDYAAWEPAKDAGMTNV